MTDTDTSIAPGSTGVGRVGRGDIRISGPPSGDRQRRTFGDAHQPAQPATSGIGDRRSPGPRVEDRKAARLLGGLPRSPRRNSTPSRPVAPASRPASSTRPTASGRGSWRSTRLRHGEAARTVRLPSCSQFGERSRPAVRMSDSATPRRDQRRDHRSRGGRRDRPRVGDGGTRRLDDERRPRPVGWTLDAADPGRHGRAPAPRLGGGILSPPSSCRGWDGPRARRP